MRRWPACALVLVAASVAACGGGSSAPSPGERILATAGQDYSKDYSQTSCGEFRSSLTAGERKAATFLGLERLRADDGLPPPSDSEVAGFLVKVRVSCGIYRTQPLPQVMARVYGQDHS